MTPEKQSQRRTFVQAAVDESHRLFEHIHPLEGWDHLQELHARWQIANFPAASITSPLTYAAGVAEEALLELSSATESWRHAGHAGPDDAAVDDALGDACVFLMGLCTQQRLDWGELWRRSVTYKPEAVDPKQALARAVGRLCQVCLKTAQGIRGLDDPATARMAIGGAVLEVMHRLRQETQWCGSRDKDAAVRKTLESVLQRGKEAHGRSV
jgi:hypothetical protein